jgi:hypothetical protein
MTGMPSVASSDVPVVSSAGLSPGRTYHPKIHEGRALQFAGCRLELLGRVRCIDIEQEGCRTKRTVEDVPDARASLIVSRVRSSGICSAH